MRKNYYELLQVQPGADPAVIKAAYRTVMGRLGAHPDMGGGKEPAQELNEAYATLSDPEKRRAYDTALAVSAGAAAEAFLLKGPVRRRRGLFLLFLLLAALALGVAAAVIYQGRERAPVWIGRE